MAMRDLAVELDAIGPRCGGEARRDVWRWRSDHVGSGDSQQRFLFVKLKENERGRGRWRSGGVRSEGGEKK